MNVSISVLVVDLNTNVTGVQSAISIYAIVMAIAQFLAGANLRKTPINGFNDHK